MIIDIQVKELSHKHIVGFSAEMCHKNQTTKALWQTFMPRRGEVSNRIGTEYYSIIKYPDPMQIANIDAMYIKWAGVQVEHLDVVPEGMHSLTIPAGLYATFTHQGDMARFIANLQYFYSSWLLNSDYHVDDRPHFEILGDRYRRDDPNSEEEVYIPLKLK